MKLNAKVSITAGVIVVVLIAAVVILWSSLDAIVEAAIEKNGSRVTQTKVGVAGVKLSLTKGAGSISGITVGNPTGFTQPNAFSLGNISTRIDTGTVTKDTVVINEIVVKGPEIFYEINKAGASNFNMLKKNIAAASGGKASGDGKEVKLIIERLIIEGGKVSAKVAALDKTMDTRLPRIELKDIGKQKGGATGAEVAEKVLNAIVSHTSTAVSALGVDKYVGKAKEEVQRQLEAVGDKGKDVGEELKKAPGDTLKKLFK